MSVTDYKVVSGESPDVVQSQVVTALGAGWQTLGFLTVCVVSGVATYSRELIKGTPDFNSLAPTGAPVLNGATVAVVNSAGADSHNAVAEVTTNSLTDVKFAATIAMVDDTDTVLVKSSTNAAVNGTHTATVTAGALAKVTLASTIAPITNGQVLSGITPSGSYTTSVTFTVVGGVITAIALA